MMNSRIFRRLRVVGIEVSEQVVGSENHSPVSWIEKLDQEPLHLELIWCQSKFPSPKAKKRDPCQRAPYRTSSFRARFPVIQWRLSVSVLTLSPPAGLPKAVLPWQPVVLKRSVSTGRHYFHLLSHSSLVCKSVVSQLA